MYNDEDTGYSYASIDLHGVHGCCFSVCVLSRPSARQNGWTDQYVVWTRLASTQGTTRSYGIRTGATWQIRLNDLYSAAMQGAVFYCCSNLLEHCGATMPMTTGPPVSFAFWGACLPPVYHAVYTAAALWRYVEAYIGCAMRVNRCIPSWSRHQ